jgi:hypothetical protein
MKPLPSALAGGDFIAPGGSKTYIRSVLIIPVPDIAICEAGTTHEE